MKAITTKYYGPTNSRGSRIIATDHDGNKATVSYDHSLDNEHAHFEAVKALCAKRGWNGTLVSGSIVGQGYVYVWLSDSALFNVAGNR